MAVPTEPDHCQAGLLLYRLFTSSCYPELVMPIFVDDNQVFYWLHGTCDIITAEGKERLSDFTQSIGK